MTFNQIRQVLDRAMKDRQPSLYEQMKANGELEEYLNRRAARVDAARGEVANDLLNDQQFQSIANPMTKVAEANSRFRAAEEVALNDVIEEIGTAAQAA
jgi:hypothetical protein